MKQFLFFITLSLFFTACDNATSIIVEEEPGKVPTDFMFMQRAYPSGEVKADALSKALDFKKNMLSTRNNPSSIWEFAGPTNIGGRVTDIEIPIDQAQTYYVGSASGGIFKTTDAGESWSAIFDDQGSLAIGDMELSKSNTDVVWVGTGESNAGGGSLAYDGTGMYNSEDGGITWEHKGLAETGSISKILIDPNDENTIFASAMGPVFRNDSNRGVYKSIDNGDTWNKVLFVSDSTGIIDMVNHPSNSNILYAAAWERIRRPQFRSYGGETSGLYRSLDGGESWNEMRVGLPTLASEKGRISIAISASNPDVLYARYANAAGSIQGVYRTNNGGESWTQVNSSQLINVGFHWWFRGIFVDPADENTLYNVDFLVQKSTNGGNTWIDAFPDVHVDQHALAFNAQNDNEVLLGNDGGLYRSGDNGSSSFKLNNLPITQFYRFNVDPQNPDRIYGGTQDNSTMRTTTGGIDDWRIIFGGDGFQPLVDANNSSTIYALSQRGNFVKSTNDGANFFSATSGIATNDRNNWDTPVAFDPQNSQTLFYGTQRVWKTTNGATSWFPISPDLTNGSGDGNLSFGTITSIDVSLVDSEVIVIGTDDSNIWITQDGGTNWNNVSSNLPNLWTTKVLSDRDDVNTIYVTFSGYRYGSDFGHVFRSNNAGATWTDIGSGLPDIPVNDIVKDANGELYVATDIGVFSSIDDGANWDVFGENMPAAVVTDLHIQESEQLLYAATYGRSAFKADISGVSVSTNSNPLAVGLKLYPNPASELITISLPSPFTNATASFYNSLGSLVFEAQLIGENSTVDISRLSQGIYYAFISDGENSTTEKLIVK